MLQTNLIFLNNEFSIHRFEPGKEIPKEVFNSSFYWIGKTDEELSVVCESGIELNSAKQESGWSVIKIIGPFELDVVGILAGISNFLASAGISIFALSTYDTDYILIKTSNKTAAIESLNIAGYRFLN